MKFTYNKHYCFINHFLRIVKYSKLIINEQFSMSNAMPWACRRE